MLHGHGEELTGLVLDVGKSKKLPWAEGPLFRFGVLGTPLRAVALPLPEGRSRGRATCF